MNTVGPEINNKLAKKQWMYLVNVVGEKAALRAIDQLAGKRRAFPVNIAKVLRISFPNEHLLPISEEEQKRLEQIKNDAMHKMWDSL